jgi:hypothetical protein
MQDSRAYSVYTFTRENLLTALSSTTCTVEDIAANRRIDYLAGYLAEIQAKTIVCEHVYVDRDYLDDFANFYAKSFEYTSSRCRRVHFFSSEFNLEHFEQWLGSATAEELTSSYLGFIVARPLATAVIGRSVLHVYPPDGGRRFYPCLRLYKVNLFGLPLVIKGLAFQEQDTSLAACATVALWSCFQKTRELFSSQSPSPASITRAANRLLLAARPFPSRSLQIQQVCNAIAAVGLDPEVYEVTPTLPLATLIYSHLRLGLPVIAVVQIPNIGGHAISINGYSIKKELCLGSEGADVAQLLPRLIGLRIDEFYGHDDQTGPHCKLKLIEPNLASSDPADRVIRLNEVGGWNGQNLIPVAVIIPVYPKIRIGFREALRWLPPMSLAIGWCLDAKSFEWDIRLAESNEYKTGLRSEESLAPEVKREILTSGLPKFLWVCTLSSREKPVFEMLLDSTAMVNGFPILRMQFVDRVLADKLATGFGSMLSTVFANLPKRFLEMLTKATKDPYTASQEQL